MAGPVFPRPASHDPRVIRQAFNALIDLLERTEPWREVGAPGQPAFQNSWVNFNSSTHETAAFYKDSLGVVRLKGLVKDGTVDGTASVFILPVGYRPVKHLHFATDAGNAFGVAEVAANGDVIISIGSNAFVALNVSFRAA